MDVFGYPISIKEKNFHLIWLHLRIDIHCQDILLIYRSPIQPSFHLFIQLAGQ